MPQAIVNSALVEYIAVGPEGNGVLVHFSSGKVIWLEMDFAAAHEMTGSFYA